MATGEETLIDAPVTPAPIFAYRALRAVFLGEQDTPEQTARLSSDLDAKVERDGQLQNNSTNPAVQLTPNNKRKHSALYHPSPTKSILRTPGAHTPRRALLKDVNVTFKDFRKSASPELTRAQSAVEKSSKIASGDKENRPVNIRTTKSAAKNSGQNTISNHAESRVSKGLSTTSLTAPSNLVTSVPRDVPIPQEPIESTAPLTAATSTTNFDADAFMHTTEKEMKKLIKYGQKMREHARRRDEENVKLKFMLDELRSENERLKKQLEASNSSNTKKASFNPGTHEHIPVHQGKSNKPSSTTAPQLDNAKWSGNFDLLDLEDILSPKPQYKDTITRSKRPAHDSTAPKQRPQDQPSPQKKQRLINLNLDSDPGKENAKLPLTKPPKPQSQHIPLPLPLRSVTNSVSSSKLAPDRLAAARARVRKKAELRKASAESDGNDGVVQHELENMGEGDGKDTKNVSGRANENVRSRGGRERQSGIESSLSLLDWADL